jgi:hypothetical protein
MPVNPLKKDLKIWGIISWLNRLDKKQKNLSYFGEFILHLEEYGEPPSWILCLDLKVRVVLEFRPVECRFLE